MSAEETCMHVRITGRVQGVAYRAWAQREAEALGLAGWVRNRRDGTVEAVFKGPAAVVRAMITDCHRGPPAARVTRVIEEPHADPVPPGFRTLPTA